MNKVNFEGKKGFYSWVQTSYKSGKVKRTQIGKSGSRKSVFKRAERLAARLDKKESEKTNSEVVKNGKHI